MKENKASHFFQRQLKKNQHPLAVYVLLLENAKLPRKKMVCLEKNNLTYQENHHKLAKSICIHDTDYSDWNYYY